MQAATGELNLTLITVVAIGLVAALFATVIWPNIKGKITGDANDTSNALNGLTYNYEFTDYIESELF